MIKVTAICDDCGDQLNLSEEEECMWEDSLKEEGWSWNDKEDLHLCEVCNPEPEETTNE